MQDRFKMQETELGFGYKDLEQKRFLKKEEVEEYLNAGSRATKILDGLIAEGTVKDYDNELNSLVRFIKLLKEEVDNKSVKLTDTLDTLLNVQLNTYK